MKYTIRDAQKTDMPQVLNLINELAAYENKPDAVKVTVNDLEHYGFKQDPEFHCFVADTEKGIVGIALVYPRFSTWKGPVLHLEDLIVSQAMRGCGLGTALLDEVIKYGESLGVKRISWEVSDGNEPAIEFYENKGANVMREWDVVHLNEADMKKYISKL